MYEQILFNRIGQFKSEHFYRDGMNIVNDTSFCILSSYRYVNIFFESSILFNFIGVFLDQKLIFFAQIDFKNIHQSVCYDIFVIFFVIFLFFLGIV